MKKFLIFLVSIVVCVCLGMTTYYFLRNDETINFKTKEIYCNTGDVITLSELGYQRIKADKDTKIDFNAGGVQVTDFVKYDQDKGYYIVGQNGGDVTLVIKTSNKKFAEFKVTLHIGNGSEQNPFYIDNEESLAKIGNTYELDKHYQLMNDVIVSKNFKTIGYNAPASSWVGFSGSFNGNGYSISGLNISSANTDKAGLFSTINSGAKVSNLTIKNAKVEGDFNSVGILAGEIYGNVSKISILNSEIVSTKNNANVGAVAGLIDNVNLTTSKVNNVAISANGQNSIVGGFAGTLNQSLIQACYASKVNVLASDSSVIGGFAGKFVIGTTNGSIQQSYANTTSSNTNFAGFIGEIETASGFDVENASMLRYLVGNIAVTNKNVVSTVNVPNNTDGTAFFQSFKDELNGYYLISSYATEDDLILETSLTFYQVEAQVADSIVEWDNNVWINANNMLPELRMGSIAPSNVAGEYIRRNLSVIYVDDISDFVSGVNKEYILTKDIVLPSNWVAVDIKNSTINGKNYSLSFANSENKAVFNVVEDSTIKNIQLVNVTTSEESNGIIASLITSTDPAFASSINNVHVTYVGDAKGSTQFGGLVGSAKNAIITDCSVTGLNYVGNSYDVAGLVCVAENTKISNCSVNATLTGNERVAGLVVKSDSTTISDSTGSVVINYSSANGAKLAGIVAENNGEISRVVMNVKIDVQNAGGTIVTGGVASENNGTISETEITGEGINVSTGFNSQVIAGGVAAYNNGIISNTNCLINKVGTYREGKNDIVAGVAAYNNKMNSKIEKVVASADVYGNTVAGVVAYMNDSVRARVDQVLVAKFNKDTNEISDNTIKGDKYIAGVSVELSAGTVSNIQANSNIIGGTSSTVSSLVVLFFPDGGNLNNSTINSSFEGNGNFYLETWADYVDSGVDLSTYAGDKSYNLYAGDVSSGSMQSVVINSEKARSKGVNSIGEAEFTGSRIWVNLDYGDSDESSYYKNVNNGEFASASTYKTDWTKRLNSGLFGWGKKDLSRSMTFDIGGIWLETNGITLAFLANI